MGLVPGGGVLTTGGDIISPYIKNEMVGQSPYTGDLTSEEFEELQDSVGFTVETAQPRSAETYANLLNGYVEKDPELRNGELSPYFGDDGTVKVPSEKDRLEFVRAADDALGRLDDDLSKGVEHARDNTEWR